MAKTAKTEQHPCAQYGHMHRALRQGTNPGMTLDGRGNRNSREALATTRPKGRKAFSRAHD